uniref:Uncharacterized protein n=1 Tax=Phocoena sinus TaxID=42100 RepID=A0A8C9E1W5_PHOSS
AWRLPADLDTTCLNHVDPRIEMAFALTCTDPRGQVEKTHLHSAGFSPSSEVSCNWGGLGSTKSSGTIPVAVSGCPCADWFFFPVPRSTSQASLQMVVRNQETKQRGHWAKLLSGHTSSWGSRHRKPPPVSTGEDASPPTCLTASCLAFGVWLLAGKRVVRFPGEERTVR